MGRYEINQGVSAYQAGDNARGRGLTEEALALARAEFGRRHPGTLASGLRFAALQSERRFG